MSHVPGGRSEALRNESHLPEEVSGVCPREEGDSQQCG